MTRINLTGDSIEQQIAEIQRLIEERKTKQFTSQNSGMLGKLVGAANKDDFGDIVNLSGDFVTPPNPTSHIPCIATPSPSHFNSIYCDQKFIPERDKPIIVIPLVRLAVKDGGLHGQSQFILSGYRFMFQMIIYNDAGAMVGEAYMVQDLGDYLVPQWSDETPWAWQTVISYTSTVPFTLSYELLCRTNGRGATFTDMEGLFF